MTEPIAVDIWSDIACPWCYIGKRRFEQGREAFAAAGDATEVTVRYHSFELAPDTPVDFDGSEEDFLVAHKGMPKEQVGQLLAQVTDVAASVGLTYDYDALQHTNTVKAHELLHFAAEKDRQNHMLERLMSAYFTEGRHVGRVDDLAELAAEIGLDREEAAQALHSERYLDAVRADQQQAAAFGINSVPFFVIDGKYGVSGAQEAATFADVLRQVAEAREESHEHA